MGSMEQIADLQAKMIRKVRIFPDGSVKPTQYGGKLIAVSSQYGFAVFFGSNNKVISVKTSEFHQIPNDLSGLESTNFSKRDFDFFEPESNAQVFSVDFNSDGRVLSVAANTTNGPVIYLFDGFTFSPGYTETPFPLTTVRLSTNDSSKMTAFEWNPCIPDSFAAGTTEQISSVQFNLANPSAFTIVGTRPIPTTCLSWSPKGKQITVGDSQGQIHQLRPEVTLVRTIPAPQSLSIEAPFSCVGVCWLSTTEWIVAFTNKSNRVTLALVTVKKGQNPVWDEWSNYIYPLFDDAASLPRAFYFWPLFDWHIVLTGSTCYPDIWPFSNDGTTWRPGYLQEPDINCPGTKDGKACQVVGGSYDFSSTVEIPISNDGSKVPPQPIFYMMTTDGVLVLYYLVSMKKSSLTKPSIALNLMETKNGQKPANFQPKPSNTLPQVQPTATTGFSFSGFNLFGQKTPQSVANQVKIEDNKAVETEKKVEEAERKKKEEEELAKQRAIEETERKKKEEEELAKQRAIEAERKKKEAELAAKAEKEAQRQALLEKNRREYMNAVVAAVNGLEAYRRAVSEFHERRMHLEESATDALEFDQRMEPYRKCIEAVRTISDSLAEDVQRNLLILKSLGSAAEEVETILNSPPTESVTPDWVLELADNLDELEERLFTTTENYTACMDKMEQVDQHLKTGKVKPSQSAVLSNIQQQTVEKNSKSINSSIVTLSKRIVDLRKKTRDIKNSTKTKKIVEILKSAGGVQLDDSVFDESLNASVVYHNDISTDFAGLYVQEKEIGREKLGDRKPKIDKIRIFLENRSRNPVKITVPISVTEILKKKEIKSTDEVIITPKVQKARETLAENLKISKELKFTPKKFSSLINSSNVNESDPMERFKNIPGFERFAGAGMRGAGEVYHSIPISVPSLTSTTGNKNTFDFKSGFSLGSKVSDEEVRKPEEVKKKIEEDKKKIEEETRKKAEEAKKKAEEEAKKKADEEAKKKADEEAKKKAEEEARKKAEEETKKKAEEEARKKAEEEAKKKMEEEEAKRKAEEEAKKKAEEEAKKVVEPEKKNDEELTEECEQLQTTFGSGFGSSSFGHQSGGFNSPFGQKSGFGSPTQTSTFGGNNVGFSFAKPGGFNPATSTTQQDSSTQQKSTFGGGFGSTGFGQQSSGFGSPLTQKSSFGSPSQTTSTFGGSNVGFSFAKPGGFNTASSTATSTTQQDSSTQQKSTFGGGFGSTGFGQQSGGFGSAFAQKSSFGSPTQTTSVFGGGSGGFSSFESKSGGFGTTTTQDSTTQQKSSFGGFGSTGFGQQSSGFNSPFAQKSSFGSPTQTTSSFGGGSGGFSSFGTANQQDSATQQKSAFGGGFGSGGFGQQSNTFGSSPFAQKPAFSSPNQTTSSFGGGFSSFANKSGGFGAIAQQTTSQPQSSFGGGFGSTTSNAFGQQKNAFNTWRS